jgi:hypothetical protein
LDYYEKKIKNLLESKYIYLYLQFDVK